MPEYAAFAAAILAAANTLRHEDPHLVAIEKAIPSVNERLRSMTSVVQTGQAAHATGLAQLEYAVNELAGKVTDFLTGSFALTFTPGRSRLLPQGHDLAGLPRQHTPPSPTPLPQSAIDLGGGGPLLPSQPTALKRQNEADMAYVPSYKLSRQVMTIPDLWKEWTVGLGGLPSVASLDAVYGSHWRLRSERQYYSMRKVIIDEIATRAGGILNKEALEAVVEEMEKERISRKASLDKFIKAIKAERKAKC
jgi:hypothetical protein